MGIRRCAVAGAFYPAGAYELLQMLDLFFQENKASAIKSYGIVSPHAGYVYSGKTAACAFSTIPEDFDGTILVIGPSHRGYETCISVDQWETPLGVLSSDTELLNALHIPSNAPAHRSEHSLEVQMPFIQYRSPNALVAPVMMGNQDEIQALALSRSIKSAIEETGREIRIVASSDFSHYVSKDLAIRDDGYVIQSLESLDLPLFYRRLKEKKLSACGYGPIATMIHVTKGLGAKEGKLLAYTTSGDVSHDDSRVVGYAAIAVV